MGKLVNILSLLGNFFLHIYCTPFITPSVQPLGLGLAIAQDLRTLLPMCISQALIEESVGAEKQREGCYIRYIVFCDIVVYTRKTYTYKKLFLIVNAFILQENIGATLLIVYVKFARRLL